VVKPINTNDDLFDIWFSQESLPQCYKKLMYLVWKSFDPSKVHLVDYSDGKQKVIAEEWE